MASVHKWEQWFRHDISNEAKLRHADLKYRIGSFPHFGVQSRDLSSLKTCGLVTQKLPLLKLFLLLKQTQFFWINISTITFPAKQSASDVADRSMNREQDLLPSFKTFELVDCKRALYSGLAAFNTFSGLTLVSVLKTRPTLDSLLYFSRCSIPMNNALRTCTVQLLPKQSG